jgi:two-component system CheB/CheR fusion protein
MGRRLAAVRSPVSLLPSASRGVRTARGPGAAATTFPIVGVGASAGGLDAFQKLLAHVPADSGLAFVLVQHLEAKRASLLSGTLSKGTRMKVAQAVEGARVEPNHVYVIPPGTQMAIEQGVLRLSTPDGEDHRPHLPIDFFLQSLAADRGRQAIGVVLSGSASDGTAGLASIRASGGITLVQDPRSARFGTMPQSAIDAGVVDFCLPLPALGAELARLAVHPYLAQGDRVPPTPSGAASLAEIVAIVRKATGVDFGEHQQGTFMRRLARRMALREAEGIASYLEVLRREPGEVQALYDDLLIKVTSFFRDERGFDELKAIAYPDILSHKEPGAPFRAWVMGCSTGEEVYSLAISLLENLGDGRDAHPILIFGSDLDGKSIERARSGIYPDAAVQRLGAERLRRFFVRTERGWKVVKAVRDLCVFVRHDIARDPPFSNLDLITCRNVLIYFGPALRKRVIAAAHYCLRRPGYLFLGPAESGAGVAKWFAPAGQNQGLFVRKPGSSTFRFSPQSGLPSFPGQESEVKRAGPTTDRVVAREVDDEILDRYGPPGVVINDRMEVVQFRGRTGPFLEAPRGEPQSQLLKMARAGLAAPLRIAIGQARRTAAPVRTERVQVDGNGPVCDLVVLPVSVTDPREGAFVVLFEERPRSDRPGSRRGSRGGTSRSSATRRRTLEDELTSTKEFIAVLLEEQGRTTDALASAHDELVSSNEELQSLNEELETAKEELQATNEELGTVNDELQGRNKDLQATNVDLRNLLDAVDTPILVLDAELRIRTFSAAASAFMGLTAADVGTPVTSAALPFLAPDLKRWIARATEERVLVEAEVQDRSGTWNRLQIRPRLGPGGLPDGTILSLVDIDALRREIDKAKVARDFAFSIVEAVQVPLLVLDAKFHVLLANAAYYMAFKENPGQVEGRLFFDLGAGTWNTTDLHRALGGVLEIDGRFQGLEMPRDDSGAGRRSTTVSGCAFPSPAGEWMVLLALEDVSAARPGEKFRAVLSVVSPEGGREAP